MRADDTPLLVLVRHRALLCLCLSVHTRARICLSTRMPHPLQAFREAGVCWLLDTLPHALC